MDRFKLDIGLKLDKFFSRINICDSLSFIKFFFIYSRILFSFRLLIFLNRLSSVLFVNSVFIVCERRKKFLFLVVIKLDNEKAEKERFMRVNFLYNSYFVYKFFVEFEVLEKCS